MSDALRQKLETPRLFLRPMTINDAEAFTKIITPEISRWLANWPFPFTHELAVERIESSLELAAFGDALPFVVIEKVSGNLAGWAMIKRDVHDRQKASFSYWMGEHYHGKGYMKEIAPVVLNAGFDVLGLDIIEAGAQLENTASFAVMKACGMEYIGEEMVYAAARKREEPCACYQVKKAKETI
ncbi:MAG: N-acetyltransferase [Alphaproteobacteria bacterium]|nr:N-acetyltransferase [Alphaproteobacteria bacterium]